MRRNFTQLHVHLVWATWDRLPLITPDIQDALYNVITYECTQMGCQVIAIGGIADHIHLLVGQMWRKPKTQTVGLVSFTNKRNSPPDSHS